MTARRGQPANTAEPKLPAAIGFSDRLADRVGTFRVLGLPEATPATDAAVARSQLIRVVERLAGAAPDGGLSVTVTNQSDPPSTIRGAADDRDTVSLAERASYFPVSDPLYDFEFLVVPPETREALLLAVDVVRLREQVFDSWNLRSIQPHPASAINLHGSPGTGKTLAAHAIASRLGKQILIAKASQLESKYHGEGPKNLDALFHAAATNDAVLFIDEADSLMSQRFENTSQGSEHAVNAMRSELLLALDRFDGLAVFATNLVTSYDPAFDSRVRHVRFPDPDESARAAIWQRHLPAELPLAEDVSVAALAKHELSGREIRRAVVDAAVRVARDGRPAVTAADLADAVCAVRSGRIIRTGPTPVFPAEQGSEPDRSLNAAVAAACSAEVTEEHNDGHPL